MYCIITKTSTKIKCNIFVISKRSLCQLDNSSLELREHQYKESAVKLALQAILTKKFLKTTTD